MKNTIFIAEDDFLLVRLYKKAFELSGYNVVAAYNGEESLSMLKEMSVKPDVIVIDILMPKMDGLTLLREIKKNPDIKDVPTVIFTNVSDDKEKNDALSLGASLYLFKGEYDIGDIVSKVGGLIKVVK